MIVLMLVIVTVVCCSIAVMMLRLLQIIYMHCFIQFLWLAHEDKELLATHDMRGVRMLLEISKPEMVLGDGRVNDSGFCGACLVESRCRAQAFMAESRLKETPDDPQLKRQFQRAQRLVQLSHFYDAQEFANLVSCRHFYGNGPMPVIATGGGPGIMEAANRGAFDAG